MESGKVHHPSHLTTRFTNDQIKVWQEFLKKNNYPKEAELKYLSSKLGISPNVIDTWFLTRQKLSETTFDIDLDSIDSALPWLQTTKNSPPILASILAKPPMHQISQILGTSQDSQSHEMARIHRISSATKQSKVQLYQNVHKIHKPSQDKMSKVIGFKVVNVSSGIHQLLQHQQFTKIDETSPSSHELPNIDQVLSAPIHKKLLPLSKAKFGSQLQLKGFKFYLDKLRKHPGILEFNGKVIHVTLEDKRFVKPLNAGHMLMLATILLQEFLGEDLSAYTLTGQRQVWINGRMQKVKDAATPLPDELKDQISNFILKSHILINYPVILENFDRYFKALVTKIFNRIHDKLQKRKVAAGKHQRKKDIRSGLSAIYYRIPTTSKENRPPLVLPIESELFMGEIKDEED